MPYCKGLGFYKFLILFSDFTSSIYLNQLITYNINFFHQMIILYSKVFLLLALRINFNFDFKYSELGFLFILFKNVFI